MARIHAQTPLSRLINTRLVELGISRIELMKRLGYGNPAKGLRRLDEFMVMGEWFSHSLKGLPDVLGLDTAQVEGAATKTRQQIAGGEEAAARERFHAHILVLTQGLRFPCLHPGCRVG